MTLQTRPPVFLIDGRPAGQLPTTIDVIPPEATEIKLAGGQRHYIEELSGVDIEAVFGIGGLPAEDLRALELARGVQSLHMITFNNISCDEIVELLVHMPKVPRTRLSEVMEQDFAYAPVTIRFHQVNPAYDLIELEWWFFESAGYSTGTGKFRVTMPSAGRFLQEGISGYWFDLIGGAGNEIHVQLRNATQGVDYFSTQGAFKVNSATKKMEDAVLISNASFVRGDIIDLDVTQITSGGPAASSAILVVQMVAAVLS